MSTSEVLLEVSDHIATVTLNAPERMNTISRAMLMQLGAALQRANDDPAVRCVILTGTGRAFCAGLDLREVGTGAGISVAARNDAAHARCQRQIALALQGGASRRHATAPGLSACVGKGSGSCSNRGIQSAGGMTCAT